MTPRSFAKRDISFEVDGSGSEVKRTFVIMGSKAPLSSVDSRNIVLRRQTSFTFDYSVNMLIPSGMSDGQSAGITGYYDENTYLEFGVICRMGKKYIYCNEHIGDEDKTIIAENPLSEGTGKVQLTMRTDYLKRTLSYDSTVFTTLENVYYLCDEGLSRGKRFTGALVGMYAYAGPENDMSVTFIDDHYDE
ncbi:MAG: hypothetical protein IKW81_01590 [Pseudobutyrivibrio sp.]|nr:hypothetical protein [Pseudobutyrivibrio sp.]